jgi:hypothetical protein
MDCTHSHNGGNRPVLRYVTLHDRIRKGNAADFISPFHVEPGDKFVLLCRVSTSDQTKHGSLLGQRTHLTQAVEERGGIVVEVQSFEWSGRGITWLKELTQVAESTRPHDAQILAATTDRFLRGFWFKGNNPILWEAQAQTPELQDLQDATRGVPLMTYLHPDATPAECKSLLTTWGQAATGRAGGRPRDLPAGYRQERKERWLETVHKLHREGGKVGRYEPSPSTSPTRRACASARPPLPNGSVTPWNNL